MVFQIARPIQQAVLVKILQKPFSTVDSCELQVALLVFGIIIFNIFKITENIQSLLYDPPEIALFYRFENAGVDPAKL